MALIKNSQVKKMSEKEMEEKLQELKMELIRGNVTANKARAKTKELKRAISRILTAMNAQKLQGKLNSPRKKVELSK